ncbi:hypothetical protein Z043_104352, partial [Scleropages formosus]
KCHSTEKDADFWKSRCMAVLQNNFAVIVVHKDTDPFGPSRFFIIRLNQIILITVNIYGYNMSSENDISLDPLENKLVNCLAKYPNASIIFGGDFNTTLDNFLDRWTPQHSSSSTSNLKIFMDNIQRRRFPQSSGSLWDKRLLTMDGWKFLRKVGSDLAEKEDKTLSDDKKKEYMDLQNDIYCFKAEGAFVRYRRQWMKEGKQNLAYFF